MKCNQCNQIIPDISGFCLFCGAKIQAATAEQPSMRTIKIKRKRSLVSALLPYEIICDGEVIATIRNGETKLLEMDEAPHTIQCCVTSPTVISGNNGTVYGKGGTAVSDVVNIPSGGQHAELFLRNGFGSLRLDLVELS